MPISLPDGETFTSFYIGQNELLINALQNVLKETGFQYFYCWSLTCSGRSHLLYAACSQLSSEGKRVAYIPLKNHMELSPEILDGLDEFSLICLDDIQCIAGHHAWEMAIFNLYNRLLDKQAALLITGNGLPKQLGFQLPDLCSRLEWGQLYKLEPLSDHEKLRAMQLRSKLRGFDLPDDVGRFLLKRLHRDMRTLFVVLDTLDNASIVAQRKLTIPFVKDSLGL